MPQPAEQQIAEKIREVRKKRNLTQQQLARSAGVTQSTIAKMEQGRMLDPVVLRTVAIILDVNLDWLLADGDPKKIPVIGYVSAGETSVEYDDQGYPTGAGFDDVDRPPKVRDPHAYALRVRGDSMEPVYKEGDTVILDTTKPVHDKDEAIVRFRGKAYFKIFRQMMGRITLQSFNREHPEIPCDPQDIQFAHRVVLIEPAERDEAQDSLGIAGALVGQAIRHVYQPAAKALAPGAAKTSAAVSDAAAAPDSGPGVSRDSKASRLRRDQRRKK